MKTIKKFSFRRIKITEALISYILFMCEIRMKNIYFTITENNKMTFKSIVIFMLNFVKKSLQLEEATEKLYEKSSSN